MTVAEGVTMGLLDELDNEVNPGKQPCMVGRFIATLPPKDAADLEQAFESGKYSMEMIRRVMMRHGFTGGATIVNRHGRKRCCCVS